jgi:hypothetical protein
MGWPKQKDSVDIVWLKTPIFIDLRAPQRSNVLAMPGSFIYKSPAQYFPRKESGDGIF